MVNCDFTKQVLLGVNSDGEIVFGNIQIYQSRKLGISFDYVVPINIRNNREYIIDRVNCLIDDADKSWLYDLCVDYDCSPTDLSEEILENWDVMDIIDCSLYPHSVELDDGTYVFESVSCGQRCPESLEVYTDKSFFNYLISLWKTSHLQILTPEVEQELKTRSYFLSHIYDTESGLKNFIKHLTN